jgi:hypothetical protein
MAGVPAFGGPGLVFFLTGLRDSDSVLAPVQWRSYIKGVNAYQGEVMDKVEIQKRFDDRSSGPC